MTTPFVHVVHDGGRADLVTLPGVLSGLTNAKISGFPALRPHQRHAWHSFLVLLAANALFRANLTELPETEDTWAILLRSLTSDYPDDSPWCLVAPPNRPALLQAPISGGLQSLKRRLATPDELDMVINAKNHDFKRAVMFGAAPEDWFFALITLQTMEGFMGAGNYGISRMNGGFANRAACSIAPAGGTHAQFRRDVSRLLVNRGTENTIYSKNDGLALVWLIAWDGDDSLSPAALDPWYIEICRRVRLVKENGVITALAGNSNVARIIPTPGGITGDPWSPTVLGNLGMRKSLTVDYHGFCYARLVELIFADTGEQSLLQRLDKTDEGEDLEFLVRALVRGQGKTKGYHERRVLIPRKAVDSIARRAASPLAEMARARVLEAGELANRVLKLALLVLFQNAPDKINFQDENSNAKADIFLKKLDTHVDANFFRNLWKEYGDDDSIRQRAIRAEWIKELTNYAKELLHLAETAASYASRRRFRAQVRAAAAFDGAFRHNIHLSAYFPNVEVSD